MFAAALDEPDAGRGAPGAATSTCIRAERQRAVAGLTTRFVTHPWPVDFLFIVSPLVTWIWLGALIIISAV